MKKKYLFLLASLLVSSWFSINAQVTGMPTGYITTTPTVSTESAPVWYNLMATNTDVARVNRYIYYDGTSLKTDLFNTPGITDALQHDKYLWRLEQGTAGAGYVILVNKLSGKKLYTENVTLTPTSVDAPVNMSDNGTEWKMAASSAVTTGTVAGQYCFNYEGSGFRYLNAGDQPNKAWGILIFNGAGSPAKSSGWFFYPVTTTKTVTFAQSANGTITATGTNGTPTLPAITTGSSVLVGTVATITVTPEQGYQLSTLTVNGTDVTTSINNGVFKFAVNADATVAATFAAGTATAVTTTKNSNAPYISGNTLNIDGRLSNSTVSVYDLCGKEELSSTESTINISSLVKGIYIVRYSTSEGVNTAKITR